MNLKGYTKLLQLPRNLQCGLNFIKLNVEFSCLLTARLVRQKAFLPFSTYSITNHCGRTKCEKALHDI